MNIPPMNFRPILVESSEECKKPRLFRSMSVDDGTHKSVKWLTDTMGIKSYIDLRGKSEYHPLSILDDHFIYRETDQITRDNLKMDWKLQNCKYRYHVELMPTNCNSASASYGDYFYLILDGCKNLFEKIFSIMMHNESFPILIACRYGKDRTGIVSALIMQLMGYDDETIVKEYVKSEVKIMI